MVKCEGLVQVSLPVGPGHLAQAQNKVRMDKMGNNAQNWNFAHFYCKFVLGQGFATFWIWIL